MYNTSLIKKTFLAAIAVLSYSCDKDFNEIGGDIIGDNHFGLESQLYDVKAYNQKVTPVAANNLAVNALGIYDNPAFGETAANFNTQVAFESYGSKLGEGAVIDSVTLNIPYFIDASKTKINTSGESTYVLDSIYGPESGKIKLSIYESGTFLNNYNAANYDISKFYNTDKNSVFEQQAIGTRLNDHTDSAENDGFFFSSKQIVETTTPKTDTKPAVLTRIAPEMRLHLNKNFFKSKIFDAPAGKLAADDVFKNYFKGLYFKVEKSPESTTSRMAMLNFAAGKIKIFYKAKTDITTDADTVMESKTLIMNLTGNTVSLLQESNPNTNYTNATTNDLVEDEKLYLKGGQGSMSILELSDFDNQLEAIRKNVTDKYWRVNEANLIFYVDETEMSKAEVAAPKRIYLYDATNNVPLRDYTTDGSTGSVAKNNKLIFDGRLQKITQNNITSTVYKIRITDHIRNILKNNTAPNVKLGLVVTEDIAISGSSLLDPTMINNSAFKAIPTASVMSPLGTVLFGGTTASGDKRVRLQVYYTKPN